MARLVKGVTLLLVFLFIVPLVAFFPVTVKANSKSIIVPDDFSTIQQAVNSAKDGDTVFVKSGTYYYVEDSNDGIFINKSISLIGEDSHSTILKPIYYSQYGSRSGVRITANNVTVSGFTISGVADFADPRINKDRVPNDFPIMIQRVGILIGSQLGYDTIGCPSGVKIIGNVIENSNSGIVMGGYKSVGSQNIISENQIILDGVGINIPAYYGDIGGEQYSISGNNITRNNVGISISVVKGALIDGNNITFNGNLRGEDVNQSGGLFLGDIGQATVVGNNITDNLGFGLRLGEKCNNTIVSNNNIERNSRGIYLSNFGFSSNNRMVIGDNRVYFNNFRDNIQSVFVEKQLPRAGDFNYSYGNGTDIVSWDNGKVGNYWSDYDGNGAYVIDQNNVDHHPLTQQVDVNMIVPTSTQSSAISNLMSPLAITLIVIVGGLLAIVISLFLYRQCRESSRNQS
jgi:hypothetical protein